MFSKPRILLIILCLFIAFLAVRQHQFVDRYSVDVLYWDSWNLYRPLFSHGNWWASFDYQHGPHRQGIGGLLMRFLANHSRWNTRCDAFTVSFALIAAAPLGAWLAFRCGVRGWALLAVPPIYLNIRQCHMFIAAANPSHGALPILMFTIYCLAFFSTRHWLRLTIQTLLMLPLIFTGFGLFVGLIAPFLWIIELHHALRNKTPVIGIMIAVVITAASWALFARGYRFDPAVPGFVFPYEHPIEYLYFIGAMIANFFGLSSATPLDVTIGLIVFADIVGVCIVQLLRLIKNNSQANPRTLVLFCLSAFTVMFATQASIGRTFIGWQTGTSSRYVTVMIPMALALLIQLATTPALARRGLAVIYGCLLVLGTLNLHPTELAGVRQLHNNCLRWRLAFLQTHDQAAANQLAQFSIHPEPVPDELQYLEKEKLNLCDPDAFKPNPMIP